MIKVFSSLTDTAPVTFADLSANVHDFWDRGLLGMALDPAFPTRPYVYVLYTYGTPLGGGSPTWGDACPTPPGPTTDGCVVSGRLSRLTASGSTATGPEQVLVNDWCQQFPSHSIGTLLFGRDGKLYVSAGDGASFNNVDWGQLSATYAGDKANPCGDPPCAVGTALSAPTAEGGALRSQSVRRTNGPATLDGSILRIDPDTGPGLSDNPFGSSTDANARRIIAYGLRNPFRMTQRPGTDELWIGDVGWNTWEEINRIPTPTASPARNFGWPCYEGAAAQGGYQAPGLTQCSTLYGSPGSVTPPHYAYNHGACVVSYTGCRTGGSSITGLAFYGSGSYPATYNGALFFADHTRNEIWAMLAGAGGVPDPATVRLFVGADAGGAAGNPVDLKTGPGGDLFYVDMEGGAVHRITYVSANQAPTARISASPTTGNAPLTVTFNGAGSTDPEGGQLSYSWDLNGDGTFGDATAPTTSYTYSSSGTYQARLRVTDDQGATGNSSFMCWHDVLLGLHGRARPLPGRRHPLHPDRARAGRRPHGRRLLARLRAGTACASRRTGPASPTSSPSIAAAYWAHSPVVVITPETGSHARIGPRRLPGDRAAADLLQDHQVPGARERTAAHGRAHRRAASTARCSSMGPTQLNIPRDYFYGEVDYEIPQPMRDRARRRRRSKPRRGGRRCSREAKFPVILAGGGVIMSNGAGRSRARSPSSCRRRSSTATCTTTPSRRPSAVVRPARLPGLEGGDEADRAGRRRARARHAARAVRHAAAARPRLLAEEREDHPGRRRPEDARPGEEDLGRHLRRRARRRRGRSSTGCKGKTLACQQNQGRARREDQGREGRLGAGARQLDAREGRLVARGREGLGLHAPAPDAARAREGDAEERDGVDRHRQHLLGVQLLPALRAAALDVRRDELRQLRLCVSRRSSAPRSRRPTARRSPTSATAPGA